MNGARFIRFYPSDWRSGCLGLTLEQSGLYIAICAHYWETAERLPLDDATAARRLGINCKNYRKVRNELLSLGKIARHEDGYCNDRAERELAAAKRASKTEGETDVDTPRGIHAGEHENGGDQVQKRGARADTITRSIDDQSPNQSTINHPIEVEKEKQNQAPSKDLVFESIKIVKKTREKGSRLSPNWELSAKNREWARVNCFAPDAAITLEADKFRDYWIAKPSATKLDWDATWRNWCRTSFSEAGKFGKVKPQATASFKDIKISPPKSNWTDDDDHALNARLAKEMGYA